MNEKIRKGIIVGLLALTMVWGYYNLSGSRREIARPRPQQNPTQEQTASPSGAARLSADIINQYGQKGWGRDPFYHNHKLTMVPTAKEKVHLKLLGIVYRDLNAQALINGQVLRIGDSLQGYRIIKINRDHVILEHDGKTLTLWVTEKGS